MSPEPLPETGVLTVQIANFVNGRRRTLWLFNVDNVYLNVVNHAISTDIFHENWPLQQRKNKIPP